MTEIRGERSVTISAPPEEVFEYIADFTRHDEWNHQIVDITKDSDGPIKVGTRLRAKERPPKKLPLPMKLLFPVMRRMVGMADHTEAEVTEVEEGKKVAWKAFAPVRDGRLWMRTEWEAVVEPNNGSTTVTQRFHYIPEHERAKKGMNPDEATQMVGDEVEENLVQLKELLESRSGR